MSSLTQKQENFCQAYIKTGNASEAYRRSYNAKNMKAETITSKASILLAKGIVRARVDELRQKTEDKSILSFKEIQKLLSERAKEELNADGLKSIDILNRMAGHYEKDNKQSKTEINPEWTVTIKKPNE